MPHSPCPACFPLLRAVVPLSICLFTAHTLCNRHLSAASSYPISPCMRSQPAVDHRLLPCALIAPHYNHNNSTVGLHPTTTTTTVQLDYTPLQRRRRVVASSKYIAAPFTWLASFQPFARENMFLHSFFTDLNRICSMHSSIVH